MQISNRPKETKTSQLNNQKPIYRIQHHKTKKTSNTFKFLYKKVKTFHTTYYTIIKYTLANIQKKYTINN